MKILQEYKGYEIVERYNKPYIKFYGGREEELPCEIPITKEQSEKAISNPELIVEYIAEAKSRLYWSAETFYEIGIVEYIINYLGLSEENARRSYEKIKKHKDIRNEFYDYIMNEKFSDKLINVKEWTAESLYNTTHLNVLGAYNYLIYLREEPEEALANLKAGLPRK